MDVVASRLRRVGSPVAVALAVSVALAGCGRNDGQEAEQRAGVEKGYVAGDGSVTELPVGERGNPVAFTGKTVEGKDFDTASMRGNVLVLNLWYAACGPCRKEAADLVSVSEAMKPKGVQFVGINTRDDAATAASFQRTFKVPYPSVLDSSGQAVLALRGKVSPNAVPTTLIVDKQGRVAGRVLGIVEESTLRSMIDAVAAEA